jgi:hypothetical protein
MNTCTLRPHEPGNVGELSLRVANYQNTYLARQAHDADFGDAHAAREDERRSERGFDTDGAYDGRSLGYGPCGFGEEIRAGQETRLAYRRRVVGGEMRQRLVLKERVKAGAESKGATCRWADKSERDARASTAVERAHLCGRHFALAKRCDEAKP